MEITYSLVYNAHITAIRTAMRLFIKYLYNAPYAFLPLLVNRATFLLIFFTNIFSLMVRYRPVTTNTVLDNFALVSLMNFHVSFYK